MSKTIEERLTAGEGDIIVPGDGTPADDVQMANGCHYDYRAQTWRDGHDHAHFVDDRGPLMFCGADLVTCASGHDGAEWVRAARAVGMVA